MPSLPKPRLRGRPHSRRTPPVAPEPAAASGPEVEVLASGGFRWVHIERPTALETAWLAEHFEFHALDLEDVLSRNQRPKIDEYDEYLFIVLHFPVFDHAVGRLGAGELDLFVGRDFLVTIPNTPLQPVEYLFERCRQKGELRDQLFAKGSGFLLYRIVDDSFDYCFPMLRKIANKLDAIEDAIFEEPSQETVRDISNAKQEIISFRRVIRPQRSVLRDLEGLKQRFLAPGADDLEVYFDDVVDAHERIWDLLESYKEVAEALEHTNEALVSQRFEHAMRVLTAIATVALPLTFLASLWGMNVGVPWEGEISGFWIIVAGMLVMLVPTLVVFRRRGWL